MLLCSFPSPSGFPVIFSHSVSQGRDKPSEQHIFLGLIVVVVTQPANWVLLLTCVGSVLLWRKEGLEHPSAL